MCPCFCLFSGRCRLIMCENKSGDSQHSLYPLSIARNKLFAAYLHSYMYLLCSRCIDGKHAHLFHPDMWAQDDITCNKSFRKTVQLIMSGIIRVYLCYLLSYSQQGNIFALIFFHQHLQNLQVFAWPPFSSSLLPI